ncbi:glycosyltransferase family 4 protein [Labrenzia sp. 011]|uniref:glycosyltransferase family 4 protein n=1 Tax=Labrenzia sp. 011 TaxID=2171494 RepID=UPI000D50FE5D|nr:glycosyltransferase family 4 protein [Labrenzia sp. 011]PVB60681.1 glycosyl transferase family 1 [Labrenzia sp. 011]
MNQLFLAFPGNLDTPTGGYGYDRRIIAGLRDLGWQVELVPLGEGFPAPSAQTLVAAEKRLAALPQGSRVVIDGLAFGAMAAAAAALDQHLSLVALVHHPLCLENGLTDGQAQALRESEHRALAFARHVIVTSPATARQVADLFGYPAQRISVVLPGTDRPGTIAREPADGVRLLSVGTVVARKGYDLLFQALSGMRERNWHLEIVGGLESDPQCYRALLQQIGDMHLAGRITFHGAVPPDALSGFYRNADIFVLASRYEGYGMAYTEALAHGLPVIGSGGGAVRETLPDGAAIYCGIENVPALREALELLIGDAGARARMAQAARTAAEGLPDWRDAAAQFAQTLQELAL